METLQYAQGSPPEQMAFEQRLKGGLGGKSRSVPDRGNGQCKGPEAGRDGGTVRSVCLEPSGT